MRLRMTQTQRKSAIRARIVSIQHRVTISPSGQDLDVLRYRERVQDRLKAARLHLRRLWQVSCTKGSGGTHGTVDFGCSLRTVDFSVDPARRGGVGAVRDRHQPRGHLADCLNTSSADAPAHRPRHRVCALSRNSAGTPNVPNAWVPGLPANSDPLPSLAGHRVTVITDNGADGRPRTPLSIRRLKISK